MTTHTDIRTAQLIGVQRAAKLSRNVFYLLYKQQQHNNSQRSRPLYRSTCVSRHLQLRTGVLLLLLLLLLQPFNGLFSQTTCVSWYQKGTTTLDSNETRDDGVLGCSGISWTICKQSASRSRQTTTPTPHHSISTGRMLFLMSNQQ